MQRVRKGFWWAYRKKACENLGIKGVDLYGGTRHSTVTFLAQHFSRDEIKEHGTGHDTSKAFERYMQAEASKSLSIYRKASEQQSDKVISVDFSKKNNDVK